MREWDFLLVPYSGDARGLTFSLHLERERDVMTFRFRLKGLVSQVKTAGPFKTGVRRDELWQTTCFEFFLSRTDRVNYYEINMSTNGDWNAYAFAKYREGMRQIAGVYRNPLQAVRSSDDTLDLSGTLRLADFPLVGPVVLGATAVLEYQDGVKDHWALVHKGEKPDFHLRESFIATV